MPPAPGAAKVELLEVKRMRAKILVMEKKKAKTGARRLNLCEKKFVFFDLHITDTFYFYGYYNIKIFEVFMIN